MSSREIIDCFLYEDAVERAKSHKRLFHYTTFNALKCIIDNKSLRLTRIDLLNDFVEDGKIVDLWKRKVFVSCFSFRERESYFFWRTYAKGSEDGVILSIEREKLEEGHIFPDAKCEQEPLELCKKTDTRQQYSQNIDAATWGVYDYSIVDITYIPREYRVRDNESFQGRFKYAEWDMESETRIRVAIRPKCSEIVLGKKGFEYRLPKEEYVYLRLSKECLQSMSITLSPFADEELESKVNQLIRENNLQNYISVVPSVLTGEI